MIKNRKKNNFIISYDIIPKFIKDTILVRNIDRIYSAEEVIEEACRTWGKLNKYGEKFDSLAIDLYPDDIYAILRDGNQSDNDYLRWRLYRAADIAEELKIQKIIIPFYTKNDAYDTNTCHLLLSILDEILQYDLFSVYIIAINNTSSTLDFFYKNHLFNNK